MQYSAKVLIPNSVYLRVDAAKAYPVHAEIVSNVGKMEAMMVPPDYASKLEANIPSDFNSLPRLLGRATVRNFTDIGLDFFLCMSVMGWGCLF